MTNMTNKLIASIMLSISMVACGGSGDGASVPPVSTTQNFGATILSTVVGRYPSEQCLKSTDPLSTLVPGVIVVGVDLTVQADEFGGPMPTLGAIISHKRKLDDATGLMSAVFSYASNSFALTFGPDDRNPNKTSIGVMTPDLIKIQICRGYPPNEAILRTRSAYQTVAKYLDMPKTALPCMTGQIFYQLKEGIATLGDTNVLNLNAALTEEYVSYMGKDNGLMYTATTSDGLEYYHTLDSYGELLSVRIKRLGSSTYLLNCSILK